MVAWALQRGRFSLNNNRTNRRRGRGNRNQGGGGQQLNRIDSRARGNAPQLLEKYKNLAQDAQHNGDRVQAEYCLQFADHYFRVIADNKARQDEARGGRRPDERGQQHDDEDYEEDVDDRRRSRRLRDYRDEHGRDDQNDGMNEGEHGVEGAAIEGSDDEGDYQPRRRNAGSNKPRLKERAPRDESGSGEFDAAALPPSISASSDDEGEEAKPRRRRRTKDDDGDALRAVG
jgi:hypothetical protein